jgi:MFS family permease
MAVGVLLYIWESERYGLSIAPWQMALPLVVMGAGMGFIVAPLTDAVLSEVPREHSGSASGLINTVQQMGNALGLGLVSVVFFGQIGDHLTRAQVGPAYVDGFQHALGWVVAVMVAIFLLMFALPKRPAQHVEGAGEDTPLGDREGTNPAAGAPASDGEPALMG